MIGFEHNMNNHVFFYDLSQKHRPSAIIKGI